MKILSNKIALVTGASRGIGRATAIALAEDGARVLVHYGNSEGEAQSVVKQIVDAGGKAEALQADLASVDGPITLAQKVREACHGNLDILVLNAGISKAGALENHTLEDFDRLFSTNVRADFFLLQQLLPVLGEGASVILVSSIVARSVPGNPGQTGVPMLSAYAATKGAIDTLARHWAFALGPQGVRVNAVAPGVIATDMSSFTKTEAGQELALGMQALKRLGRPEDVADVIAFLASDKSRWITGATIPVDGGTKL